jgi:Uma2 family endonuclease
MAFTHTPAAFATQGEIPLLPSAEDGRVRFSREAYHRMFEIGVLSREQRFELLDGEIVMMSPLGPSNSALIGRLMNFFVKPLRYAATCRIQMPIVVSDHSEPEPDVALVQHREDDYFHRHPGPSDIMLIIEVAQSSLRLDLRIKLRLYASSGIVEYWVVDVENQIVIVHRQPNASGYQDVHQFGAEAVIAPLAVPECQLDLSWLFR